MRAMTLKSMLLGHTATHSLMLVHDPKPSLSMAATMLSARVQRSGCPCGSRPRCEIFAPVNSMAEALGHAATHAPHAMQAAASMAESAFCLGTGLALPSGA